MRKQLTLIAFLFSIFIFSQGLTTSGKIIVDENGNEVLFGDFGSTGRLSFPWPINTEEGSNADKDNLLFEIGYGL